MGKAPSAPSQEPRSKRGRNAAIFLAVTALWLVLDQVTKSAFERFEVGQAIPGSDFGLMDFVLVHNTGAAWGMFGDATSLLAIFSIVVCVLAIVYLFVLAPNSSVLATVSVSLVVAGGIGNVIDRVSNGYVIDFIHATFIDFPVFNVADIGVTCGVVLFIVSLLIGDGSARKEREDG